MLYQETFQSGECPAEINVSGCIYKNGMNQENIGFPNHCHSFFEIEYILEGAGQCLINGMSIKTPEHSLLVKPPLCVHGSIGNKKSQNMIIQFGYNFINKNASTFMQNYLLMPTKKLENNCILPVDNNSRLEYLLSEIENVVPTFITPFPLEERKIHYSPKYEWKLNSLTLEMIVYLLEQEYLAIDTNAYNFSDVAQLQTVLNQLIKYPERKITLEDAARQTGMSYAYFSRTFKKTIGLSFVDYCNTIKIRRAEELLKSRAMSVTDIAIQLGFGSTSYFNRIFKQYNGNTPTHYQNSITY